MRRDYKTAVSAAVNALYSRDEEHMVEALFEILEALDPEIAELMHDDEDAALAKVNADEDSESDDDEVEVLDPENLFD